MRILIIDTDVHVCTNLETVPEMFHESYRFMKWVYFAKIVKAMKTL